MNRTGLFKGVFLQRLCCLCLWLAALNGSISFGQAKWTLRQPNVGPRPYIGIRMVDSLRGYAIGQSQIQNAVTINGGKYWARRKNPLADKYEWLQKCFFIKPTLAYHTTKNGLNLCRISNGGLTYDTISQSEQIWDMWFADSLQGYSIKWYLDYVKISKTVNGGQSWTMMSEITGGSFVAASPIIYGRTISELWLVGDTTIVRKSTDSGATWSVVNGPFNVKRIDGIKWIDNNVGFILCDSAQYFKTTNAGATWEKGIVTPFLGSNNNYKIQQIDFVNANTGFALVYSELYKTTNGGSNWTKIRNPLKSYFGPFHLVSEQKLWITTDGGIAKTENGGVSWIQQTKGTDAYLINSCIQSSNRAWAVGGTTVLNTKDRGRTWRELQLDTAEGLIKVIFPRPDVGYILGSANLYRSTNGGETWLKKGPPSLFGGPFNRKVQFLNADTGFLSNTEGLFVTTDKGENWTRRLISPDVYETKNFYFADFNHGFFLTNEFDKPKTYRTKDNGLTWAKDSLNWSGGTIIGMHFTDSLNGLIYYGWLQFGGTNGLFKTTDGGATWNYFGDPQPNGTQELYYGGNNTYYVNTFPNLFRKAENGGSFWVEGDTTDQPNFNRFISFYKNKPVLIVGQGGAIYTSDDWTGQDNYVATGRIVRKNNNDCVQDANETPVQNQIVMAEPGAYYVSTEANGKYILNIDTGTYTVKQIRNTPTQILLSSQFCPPGNASIPIQVTDLLDTISGYNFINDVKLCPVLVVKQNQQRLRPCMNSLLSIMIVNEGNIDSDSEFVHVKFPHHLYFISANAIYSFNATDSTYRFKIKPLQPNQSITINIVDSVACLPNELTGQTLCVKATIPNVPNCLLQSPNWDGANLEVASRCLSSGQSRFSLRNTGNTMPAASQYQIFIDSALVYQAPFQLAANNSMSVTLPANAPAGFVRFVVPQSANHPLSTFASAEANCATGLSTNGLFPPPDQSPLVDIECVTVTNSFDPNDKQVYPTGWGQAGNVEPETEFTYKIRFQNTGTDTAFKVVLVDTLDQNLDIASLQIGIASHPFEFKVSGKGRPVLGWTFKNIMLPDSNRNEQKSHGFVNFSIRPKASLALGTRLENFADIYFDFNDPIRTNTTVNTLWRPTYTPGILDTVFTESKKIIASKVLKISPNPASEFVQIELPDGNSATVDITDLLGKSIKTLTIAAKQSVSIKDIKPGIYILKIEGYKTERLVVKP